MDPTLDEMDGWIDGWRTVNIGAIEKVQEAIKGVSSGFWGSQMGGGASGNRKTITTNLKSMSAALPPYIQQCDHQSE